MQPCIDWAIYKIKRRHSGTGLISLGWNCQGNSNTTKLFVSKVLITWRRLLKQRCHHVRCQKSHTIRLSTAFLNSSFGRESIGGGLICSIVNTAHGPLNRLGMTQKSIAQHMGEGDLCAFSRHESHNVGLLWILWTFDVLKTLRS